jgi:hypothetical protein
LIWKNNIDRSWCDLTICTLFIRTKYWHFTFILYSLYIPQFHHSHLGLWVCSKNLVEKFNCSMIIFSRSSNKGSWQLNFVFWPQNFLSIFEKIFGNPVRKTSVQQTISKLWFFLKSKEVKRAEPNTAQSLFSDIYLVTYCDLVTILQRSFFPLIT